MTKVVIIGSGIVGATIAYELSRLTACHLTLIDRNLPASGSTGAALGVLMGAISQKKTGRGWQLREKSLQRYETLIPELEALTGIKIPYNRQGILKLCFHPEEIPKWEKLIKTRQKQGWELRFLGRERLQTQCPHLDSENCLGAIYSPQDRQVHPTPLTHALVTAAQQNGVNCQFGVTVDDFLPQDSGQVEQLKTSQGILDVDRLIITAGLGSMPLTTSLHQTIEMIPVLGQALHLWVSEPLGKEDFQPVITGDDVHLVPLGNQEYWIGATVEFPTEETILEADQTQLETMLQKAIAFCPELKTATILNKWSGKRPRPLGRLAPIIERLPNFDNVLIATGHYRNGVLLAPGTAQELLQWI